MRILRGLIFGVTMLALSAPGYAVCGPGQEGCEPSANEARAKVETLLNSAYVTPHTIVSMEKLDGRGFETKGRKVYEMRFSAVLSYSGRLVCKTSLCPELSNYLVEVDAGAKKATIAGWLFFEQSEQGWR